MDKGSSMMRIAIASKSENEIIGGIGKGDAGRIWSGSEHVGGNTREISDVAHVVVALVKCSRKVGFTARRVYVGIDKKLSLTRLR